MPDRMPKVWRVHLRPTGGPKSSPQNAVDLCLRRNIVGIGWQVRPTPRTPDEYWQAGDRKYTGRGHKGWSAAANAILWRIADGDLVWFRDTFGIYYLGQVSGDWDYRDDLEYREIDIVNVRPCKEIYPVGTTVAGKIISAFIRGYAVREIPDYTARLFTTVKFNELSGKDLPVHAEDEGSIFSLLSAIDLEDLVGLYLQFRRRLLVIPSSRQPHSTTISHEFELVEPRTGDSVYVQVKSGNERIDPSRYYGFVGEGQARKYVLFSPAGYVRESEHPGVTCLVRTELTDFIEDARDYLPSNIRTWLDWLERVQVAPRE